MEKTVSPGRVLLVGAGPGAADLLTLRAVRALGSADVVVHDGLVGADVMDLVPASARLISVAKKRDRHTMQQDAIGDLLVAEALAGNVVVRLKGGDPFIFGRGGEEVAACAAAGVPVEVIPGVSSALGAAAAAQMPLTHRDHASIVSFVAGECRGLAQQNWVGLAGKGRTLVIYMGVTGAERIADKLMADGLAPIRRLRSSSAPRSPTCACCAACSPASAVSSNARRLSRPLSSSSVTLPNLATPPRFPLFKRLCHAPYSDRQPARNRRRAVVERLRLEPAPARCRRHRR